MLSQAHEPRSWNCTQRESANGRLHECWESPVRPCARYCGRKQPKSRNLRRPEKAEPYRERILELFSNCKGNLVRVHEELVASGVKVSYPALTAFCRRHGIGQAPVVAAGRYDFSRPKRLSTILLRMR